MLPGFKGIGDGLPLSPFGAITILDIENAKVVEGITYALCRRFNLAASGTFDVILDPTGFTGQIAVLQPIGFDAIGGPITVDVYRGAVADDNGTVIQPVNKNHIITDPGQVIFRTGMTGVVPGVDLIGELLVPSDGSGVANNSGATSGETLVCVLDRTKKYLFRITNTDNSNAAILGLKTDHFEVP